MRASLIIAFVLLGCTRPAPQAPTPVQAPVVEPTKPAPPSRNFVCESFAAVNDKAICAPELSGDGDRSTHTARVTIDQQIIRCALNDTTPSIVCGPLIHIPQQQPAEPTPKPSKPTKGKKR